MDKYSTKDQRDLVRYSKDVTPRPVQDVISDILLDIKNKEALKDDND